MTQETDPASTPRRRPFRLVLLAVGVVAVLALLVLALPLQARSQRGAIVDQMLRAANADDQIGFSRLVTPNGSLWSNFDVMNDLSAASLKGLIRNCRALDSVEGLDTVSVQFDCAQDANEEFHVDFQFCGQKVHRVSWPEGGRSVRSPVGRDLADRALSLVDRDAGPCSTSIRDMHIKAEAAVPKE